jgi:hypothetical protein
MKLQTSTLLRKPRTLDAARTNVRTSQKRVAATIIVTNMVTNMPMQQGRLHNLQKPNAVLSEQVKQTARESLLSPASLARHTRHAVSWSRHSTSSSTEPNCLAVHAPNLSSISDGRPANATLHYWSSSRCQDTA